MKHPTRLAEPPARPRARSLSEDTARPDGRAQSITTEHFLRHVTWPEEAQLQQDEYWGPRLRATRATRARALIRRIALGAALLTAIALLAAAASYIPVATPAPFAEQPINP